MLCQPKCLQTGRLLVHASSCGLIFRSRFGTIAGALLDLPETGFCPIANVLRGI
jgi:hypothetical protein